MWWCNIVYIYACSSYVLHYTRLVWWCRLETHVLNWMDWVFVLIITCYTLFFFACYWTDHNNGLCGYNGHCLRGDIFGMVVWLPCWLVNTFRHVFVKFLIFIIAIIYTMTIWHLCLIRVKPLITHNNHFIGSGRNPIYFVSKICETFLVFVCVLWNVLHCDEAINLWLVWWIGWVHPKPNDMHPKPIKMHPKRKYCVLKKSYSFSLIFRFFHT